MRDGDRGSRRFGAGWRNRLAMTPGFRRWAARFWLTRGHVRREGTAIFDLVSGFAQSQVLRALIELRVLHLVLDAPRGCGDLARETGLPPERAEILLRAGVALGLLRLSRGRYRTSLRGAALLGVPGLEEMVRHHDVLYRDLSDPVAFFRGETETELAAFWPYVFGAGAEAAPGQAARYSRLMADSQTLVAEDTLDAVDLTGVRRLVDIGGGTGAFLAHVAEVLPSADLVLFDLPQVMEAARAALAGRGIAGRIALVPGDFRTDPLPRDADAVTLIRVLYDHGDAEVRALLARIRGALGPGGRIVVSEPMTGGERPEVAGDVYFALYCLAMRTGRARSPARIAALLREAGFERIGIPRSRRPFVTGVVTGHVPRR